MAGALFGIGRASGSSWGFPPYGERYGRWCERRAILRLLEKSISVVGENTICEVVKMPI
jgi:hypothetical protein